MDPNGPVVIGMGDDDGGRASLTSPLCPIATQNGGNLPNNNCPRCRVM